jgi:hypothetical protein
LEPVLPRELSLPFRDEYERNSARQLLVRRDHLLRKIERLGKKRESDWTKAEVATIPTMTNGVFEPPRQRVSRWSNLFEEELTEVHRLAERSGLGDIELREANYLAARLLATVTNRPINEVDKLRLSMR